MDPVNPPSLQSIQQRLLERQHSSSNDNDNATKNLNLSTLRIHSVRHLYTESLLRKFYNELMIPNFPIEEERDDVEDWIYCLDPKEVESCGDLDFGPAMDVLLLVCDTMHMNSTSSVYDATTTTQTTPKEEEERLPCILAGIAVEYYKHARCGLVSYIVVSHQFRRNGIITMMHDAALSCLNELHVQIQYSGSYGHGDEIIEPLRAVFAETNTVDAGDAPPEVIAQRHEVLLKLGYRQLEFPYVQPQLSEDLEPFHTIMLLVYQGSNSSNDDEAKVCFPTNAMSTDIPFDFVTDFYKSVYGYEVEDMDKYYHCDYYAFVRWYRQHYPTTPVNSSTVAPWLDVKGELRALYMTDMDKPEKRRDHVLVVGAGASGLAATVTIAKAAMFPIKITLVEANSVVGGRIRTILTDDNAMVEQQQQQHQRTDGATEHDDANPQYMTAHSSLLEQQCSPFAPWPVPIGAEFVHGVNSMVNHLIESNDWITEETFDFCTVEEYPHRNSFTNRPCHLNRSFLSAEVKARGEHVKVFGDGRCWNLRGGVERDARFPMLVKRAEQIWDDLIMIGEQAPTTVNRRGIPGDMSLADFVEQQTQADAAEDVETVKAIMDAMFVKTAGSDMDVYGVNEASREEWMWEYTESNWRTEGCFSEVVTHYLKEIEEINDKAALGEGFAEVELLTKCPIASIGSVDSVSNKGHKVKVLGKDNSVDFLCDKVIVTAPLAVLKAGKIQFEGDFALPPEKKFAIDKVNMLSGMKAHILLKKNVDIVDKSDLVEHTELIFCPNEIFTQVWLRRDADSVFLTGFVVATFRTQLKTRCSNGESAEMLFLDQLKRMFVDGDGTSIFLNEINPTCSAFALHDWADDEYVMGLYSSPSVGAGWQDTAPNKDATINYLEPRPTTSRTNGITELNGANVGDKVDSSSGETTSDESSCDVQTCRHHLARPIKSCIFFAGEHTNITTCATVQAALESGVRAAEELVSALEIDRRDDPVNHLCLAEAS